MEIIFPRNASALHAVALRLAGSGAFISAVGGVETIAHGQPVGGRWKFGHARGDCRSAVKLIAVLARMEEVGGIELQGEALLEQRFVERKVDGAPWFAIEHIAFVSAGAQRSEERKRAPFSIQHVVESEAGYGMIGQRALVDVEVHPLLAERRLETRRPDAPFRAQAEGGLQAVVALNVLGLVEQQLRIAAINARELVDVVAHVGISGVEQKPFPRQCVAQVAADGGQQKGVARLVGVAVVILYALAQLLIGGAIDVGGIGELHFGGAHGHGKGQRGKPFAIVFALRRAIDAVGVVVEIDVFVAQSGLQIELAEVAVVVEKGRGHVLANAALLVVNQMLGQQGVSALAFRGGIFAAQGQFAAA